MSTQQQTGGSTQRQDSGSGTSYQVDWENLGSEVMNLKQELALQRAINSGTEATQAAVQAGQASTNAAAHAGQIAAGMSLIAGIVIGLMIGVVARGHAHVIER